MVMSKMLFINIGNDLSNEYCALYASTSLLLISFNRLPEEDNMIDYLYITPEGKKGYSAFTADEALERYNIRIIKWEYSKQIENSYK